MMGLDPERDLTAELAAAYTEFLNNRVREGWEWEWWPELMVIEQRAYRKKWNGTDTFATGAEVYNQADDLYYRSLVTNTNVRPESDATKWAVAADLVRYVPLASFETDEETIGHVKAAFGRDPRVSGGTRGIGFWLSTLGIQFASDAPARPWLHYRLPPAVFTVTPWSSSSAYVAGDRRYLEATGECYVSIQAGTNKNPATETNYWEVVPLPYVISQYAKLATYADALADDGQTDKAEKVRGDTDNPRPGTAYYELQRAQDVEMAGQSQFTFAMR